MHHKLTPVIFGKKDVKFIAIKTLYKGFFTMKLYKFKHRLFNGIMSKEVSREVLERVHAVVVLPYDPKMDMVVLLEQIRIASYNSSDTPWLLELVAGMIKPGETIEEVAKRESLEETGLIIGRCKKLFNYLVSPGSVSERISIMIGEVDASKAKGIHGLIEENEDIRLHVVSRKKAYLWIEEGIIDNAASIIAMQWLELYSKILRDKWNT